MIPLWLTPKVMKLGVIGIIVMVIFFAGWNVKGKLVKSRTIRLKHELTTIQSNFDLCMSNLDRSQQNYDTIKEAVESASAEAQALNESYQKRVADIQQTARETINRINTSHTTAMRNLESESNELRERMATLNAAESCHLAMQEIVK
jgi:chromosome segregation ATPase